MKYTNIFFCHLWLIFATYSVMLSIMSVCPSVSSFLVFIPLILFP